MNVLSQENIFLEVVTAMTNLELSVFIISSNMERKHMSSLDDGIILLCTYKKTKHIINKKSSNNGTIVK